MIPYCLSFLSLSDFVRFRQCSKYSRSLTEKPEAMPQQVLHINSVEEMYKMKYHPQSLIIGCDIDLSNYDMHSVTQLQCNAHVKGVAKCKNLRHLGGQIPNEDLRSLPLQKIDACKSELRLSLLPPATIYHNHDIDPSEFPNFKFIYQDHWSYTGTYTSQQTHMNVRSVSFDWINHEHHLKELKLTAILDGQNNEKLIACEPKLLTLDLELILYVNQWGSRFPQSLLSKITALIIHGDGPPVETIMKMTNLTELFTSQDDVISIRCENSRFEHWPHLNIMHISYDDMYDMFNVLQESKKIPNHFPKAPIDIVPNPNKAFTIIVRHHDTYDEILYRLVTMDNFNVEFVPLED